MDYAGKSFVVTGGAGFIGSHMVDALLARGAQVTLVDNFSTGFEEFLPTHTSLVVARGDLLDFDFLQRTFAGHDFVFHFAANADVREGLKYPRRDVEQNTLATHNVLEAMRANGIRRIAFSSTGAIYGDTTVIPTPEDAPFPVQTSLYGASKVAGEGLLTAYAHGYGFETFIYRFVSLLGPRYTHGHVMDFYRKLRDNPAKLDVLGDGHQKKSYLHILDCVRAMLTIVEKSASKDGVHIYNIGHSAWLEVNESIGIICRELKVSPELTYAGGERGWVGDSPRLLLDTNRLRGLGWVPEIDVAAGVVDTLNFLMENEYCLRRK
ncbi:NAD-dependent epimerase/dehydratase family protein [soil metagenome]